MISTFPGSPALCLPARSRFGEGRGKELHFTESKHGSFHRLDTSREEVTFTSIESDDPVRVIILEG